MAFHPSILHQNYHSWQLHPAVSVRYAFYSQSSLPPLFFLPCAAFAWKTMKRLQLIYPLVWHSHWRSTQEPLGTACLRQGLETGKNVRTREMC